MLVRPLALGQLLRRTVVRPRSVAALLACHTSELAFRLIVQAIFPDEATAIWQAGQPGASRETARVEAFLRRVEAQFCPLYEAEEYDQVAWGIPFIRLGWRYEDFHALDRRLGELLLLCLCEAPVDVRVPLLDWAEARVPPEVLTRLPPHGFSPAELHAQFDGTSCVAIAEFADWLWGDTATAFLDYDDEVEVMDADWTLENLLDLAAQWRRAQAILDRIDALAAWLEADPATHFTRLLDAALGQDAGLIYQRTRRLYELEITDRGLVAIDHAEHLPLPVGAAP